jgi:hypothetical protein
MALIPPPPQASVSPYLEPKGGRSNTRLRARRGGGDPIRTTGQKAWHSVHILLRPTQPFPWVALHGHWSRPIFLMHSLPIAANWRGLITVAENLLFCECSVPKETSFG